MMQILMVKIPSILAIWSIPLSRQKRTANELLAELNAEVIDVEEKVDGINIPSSVCDDDVMEEEDSESGSHGKDSIYFSKLDNAKVLNNKSCLLNSNKLEVSSTKVNDWKY